MQALLAALKETTAAELATILKLNSHGIMKYPPQAEGVYNMDG